MTDETDRRTTIVRAVWALIAGEGIDAVTMRKVAARAGVSVGLVQHHFGTREQLVRASAEAMVAAAQDRYDAAAGDAAPGNAVPVEVVGNDPAAVEDGGVQGALGVRGDSSDAGTGIGADTAAENAARLRFAVGHVIPRTAQARLGTTVWLAYVAKSVGDPQIAAVLAQAKRGQEDEVTRLLGGSRDAARRLIALADGLATRVLIGALTPDEADSALEAEVALASAAVST